MPTLPRTIRLRRRKDFARVFSEGKSARSGQVSVRYQPRSPDAGASALCAGFVVAKRHVRTAVRRNRLRRLLRESYRVLQAEFRSGMPLNTGADIVFIWNGDSDQAVRPSFQTVHADMQTALRIVARKLLRIAQD